MKVEREKEAKTEEIVETRDKSFARALVVFRAEAGTLGKAPRASSSEIPRFFPIPPPAISPCFRGFMVRARGGSPVIYRRCSEEPRDECSPFARRWLKTKRRSTRGSISYRVGASLSIHLSRPHTHAHTCTRERARPSARFSSSRRARLRGSRLFLSRPAVIFNRYRSHGTPARRATEFRRGSDS